MGDEKLNRIYSKRCIGNQYEDIAVDYLIKQGYKILERNFYSRHKEIDIIARDKQYIVFVEVKYRKDDSKGSALESISYRKKMNIIKSAKFYLYKHYYGRDIPVRFDVVCIQDEDISLIKDAFWIE
ncbi:MAG: YraN family protein [Lachnospiraceae bacterium]|nr:YraN family protein [Lachnospiraceae bacterium]